MRFRKYGDKEFQTELFLKSVDPIRKPSKKQTMLKTDAVPFYKYHALGNDYLVLNPEDHPERPDPATIQRICHRNYGLGSDGILYGPFPTEEAPSSMGLRIFNPDGSEAEKSGNGLRIFARYLFDSGIVTEAPFQVWTEGGLVEAQILDEGSRVKVEMGAVSFNSTKIPVRGSEREVLNETLDVNGQSYTYCAATIGNPHAVFPMDTISEALVREIGPVVETHENFPNRTNVQIMQVLNRSEISIEIWERGAGYTLASGSSSSACAAVARKLDLVDHSVVVHCPGGDLEIEISDSFQILMTGGVTRVGEMKLDLEALR